MGGGGGLFATGYRAPGEVDDVMVLVHGDPTARHLDKSSRRLTFSRAKGKELAFEVKIETWSGKSWSKSETRTVRGCGGFAKEANVSCYELWLSPFLLGVKPFTKIAAMSCFASKGRPAWTESGDFKEDVPATWGAWSLR
jgi:hypothetical protein